MNTRTKRLENFPQTRNIAHIHQRNLRSVANQLDAVAMLLNSAQGRDFQSRTLNAGIAEILESLKIKLPVCAIESGKFSWKELAQEAEPK
jgi:hypothetical protein